MPDFCETMDCSLPGSSVHGISLPRILWVATFFSRGSSQLRNQKNCIDRCILYHWSTREAHSGFLHSKRHLLLGRKVMTNLENILKSRDITLPTKICLVRAMVFPVVKYGCECWTIKKAKHWRIDAFELWYWRRLLRDPWTARRSNQSLLKEISPEYSLEGLMLKLKLQYFGHLMQRTNSFEKTLMLGKIEGRRRRGLETWDGWMASLTQWTWVWVNSGSWWWTGRPGVLQPMGLQRVRHLFICLFCHLYLLWCLSQSGNYFNQIICFIIVEF